MFDRAAEEGGSQSSLDMTGLLVSDSYQLGETIPIQYASYISLSEVADNMHVRVVLVWVVSDDV